MRIRAGLLVTMLAVGGCSSIPVTLPASAGSWHVAYTGYGQVRSADQDGDRTFVLEPARPESASSTHAALVLSAHSWHDFEFAVRLRTTKQLRRPRPNNWEVGWLLWHYSDDQHFYYLILKPNGFELGKEDPIYPGRQKFLVTDNQPRFPVGRWYVVRVRQRGDAITVTVNGRPLVHYADVHNPYRCGYAGLYTEDAAVDYRIVDFKPAP